METIYYLKTLDSSLRSLDSTATQTQSRSCFLQHSSSRYINMARTCNERGERLRDRAQLVADRAADGGRVLRQARRLRAARVLREVEERHLLRGSANYVTKLV